MIWIDNNKINLYEGDTGTFPVYLEGDLFPGDILQFRIKENLDDEKCIHSKDYAGVEQGEVLIEIDKATTELLKNDTSVDKKYYYGFKLLRENNIDTVLAIGELIVRVGV